MASGLRILLAIAITIASSIAVATALREMEVNSFLRAQEIETARAFEFTNASARAGVSRTGLAATNDLLRTFPHDADLHLLAAANHRLVGRLAEAEHHYLAALETKRRPQIFLQLGHVRMQMGNVDAAYDSYAMAVRFSRSFLGDVGRHRSPVLQRLEELEMRTP